VIDRVIAVARSFDGVFEGAAAGTTASEALDVLEAHADSARLCSELEPSERTVDSLLEAIARLVHAEHTGVDVDWAELSETIGAIRSDSHLAAVVAELAIVANWERSRSGDVYSTKDGGLPQDEWTDVALPLAKDLLGLDAVWSCEALCEEAIGVGQMRMMYGFYKEDLEAYLDQFRSVLSGVEARRRDARDLLAFELERSSSGNARLCSCLAAVVWALGDAPQAHLVVHEGRISRRVATWAIVQTLHYTPPDPLVGALWDIIGHEAAPDLTVDAALARRLRSAAGGTPVHRIARGSSPPLVETTARALVAYFAGDVSDSTKRDMVFVDETWGDILAALAMGFAIRLRAVACLILGGDASGLLPRWNWLAISAARDTASTRNGGFADEDDVSLAVALSYLPVASPDDLVSTLDLIERSRIAGLEYWLLAMRPPLPPAGDPDVDALIDVEAQLLTDMRGMRFVRLLPDLPKHYLRHVIDVNDMEAAGDLQDQGRALERMARIPHELAEVWSALEIASPDYGHTRRNPFLSVDDFVKRLTTDSGGDVLSVVAGSS
jgi:hypothetical protein